MGEGKEMCELELKYIGNELRKIELLISVIAGVKTVEEYKEDRQREWKNTIEEDE